MLNDWYDPAEDAIACPVCDNQDLELEEGYPDSFDEPGQPPSAYCGRCEFEWDPSQEVTAGEVNDWRMETIVRLDEQLREVLDQLKKRSKT